MLAFLQNLPEDYFVYRELQLIPQYEERVRGMEKKQPDFVVVSPATGVMAIEVKDWNLTRNSYEWRDQFKVHMTDRSTGQVREIDNPKAQADAYLYALLELVAGLNVFVSSIVAFPTITRATFLNQLENITVLQNPQSRFYLDLRRTLFREDLDQYIAQPEVLLVQVAKTHAKFRPATADQVERVHMRLLPSSFRVGDYTARQQNQHRLKMITAEQQRWIEGLDGAQNYLLDVAGSGKTNVLISKAMRMVEASSDYILPRILITTYSRNLETNIRRIFQAKIADSPIRTRYQEAIAVQSIPALMEQMVLTVPRLEDIERYRSKAGESPEAHEKMLRDDVEDILRSEPDRFRHFDHVFVDEIQDFDDYFLLVAAHLCKARSFFFVGDLGQKIYERTHSLERLGFVQGRMELKKSYKMFRTPRYIAELATRFILRDPLSRKEFAAHGYSEDFKYPNRLKNMAEIVHSEQPEGEAAGRVRALLDIGYANDDILVITSEARLAEMERALRAAGIEYALGEPVKGSAVSLTTFMEVKGLEKEVVLVMGIEDLYDRSKPQAMFDDEDSRYRKELLSRRKVYVALTRPLEQLVVLYKDGGNCFIGDLVEIGTDILNRRGGIAMRYQYEEKLRERAERFVEALLQAGLQAAIVPGSFRDYSVKVSVSRSGCACGNVNLYYSSSRDQFSCKTNELRDQNVVQDLEECWQRSFQCGQPTAAPAREGVGCCAYVDGSCINSRIGYGVVILQAGNPVTELSGSVEDEELQGMRQVGGELQAVYETVKWCLVNGIRDVTIYYDYEGIEKWATGAWKANKAATRTYAAAMSKPPITIRWQKVKSHSGDHWNERADTLAKEGTRAGRKGPEAQQNQDPLAELATRAERFVLFLNERGVNAVYKGILNNQYARVAVEQGGYMDVYNTRNRSPAKPYLHGFPDAYLQRKVEDLWQEYYERRTPEGDTKKTGLDVATHYYKVLEPYRDCAFDFVELATALDRAYREAKSGGLDIEANRYDFQKLEAAYRELKGDSNKS